MREGEAGELSHGPLVPRSGPGSLDELSRILEASVNTQCRYWMMLTGTYLCVCLCTHTCFPAQELAERHRGLWWLLSSKLLATPCPVHVFLSTTSMSTSMTAALGTAACRACGTGTGSSRTKIETTRLLHPFQFESTRISLCLIENGTHEFQTPTCNSQ